jgi:hypothetical protein
MEWGGEGVRGGRWQEASYPACAERCAAWSGLQRPRPLPTAWLGRCSPPRAQSTHAYAAWIHTHLGRGRLRLRLRLQSGAPY